MSEVRYERRCGCGCFTIILEFIAFMLLCNLIGCEWAERGTKRLVGYAHRLWNETERVVK